MLNKVVVGCILWLALAGFGTIRAQDFCSGSGGGFSINGVGGTVAVTGCAPFNVTVTNTVAGANNLAYNFDYKGENVPGTSTATTFRYTQPGRYRILQVGSSGATGIALCREVIVVDRTPPNVQIIPCSGNKVKVIVTDNNVARQYDQLEIDWNDPAASNDFINKGETLEREHTYSGTGQRQVSVRGVYWDTQGSCDGSEWVARTVILSSIQLNTVAISRVEARADGTFTLSYLGIQDVESEVLLQPAGGTYAATGVKNNRGGNQQMTASLPTSGGPYQVRLRTTDACGNALESNEVAVMQLTAQAENEQNVLSWNRYAPANGFTQYQLLRDGVVIQRFTNIANLTYTDTDVQCGETYRYQVIAVSATVQSLSAPVEIMAVSTQKPDAITQAIVSVEQDGSVSLIAFPPAQGQTTTYKMVFERSENLAGPYVEVGVADNTNRYSDATARTSERSYCYRILYENACGNRSDPSEVLCTVWLSRSGSNLRWTPDRPFTDAIGTYFVIKYNTNGTSAETGVGTSQNYDPRLDDPDQQEFTYQVRVRSGNGSFLSYSNVIDFRREAALFLPDAFSPNGDNINDVFRVQGTFFDAFQMIIYNKWGEVIFSSTDASQGWDGTVRGERAPEGNYVYKVEIKDNTGKPFVKTGSLLLLR
ncbi:gliding motility-associated-like protein [Rhabdobacter roseus]|uniref:Gliding motility-associated-like protein n=1 Tax=Rhabdobacter roseus TaxID=1655419 RepID=A0A840TLX2_9BACT|nr:gliding motility-associated C-terminal domain-containing protein [Rhabdobacter roseus]MBB5282233.1 gliding motility-associated-like protein [Rhabdobacter roseus]